ncbi:hypothetical protein [Microcoleus asticus]
MKSSDREVRSHRATKKVRSSVPVNPPRLAPSTAAAFPGFNRVAA